MEHGQGADREKPRRVEQHEWEHTVQPVRTDEPGRPRAVEAESQLHHAAPGATARIALPPPLPALCPDAELGSADEAQVAAPERREHGQARAPGQPDADHHDRRQPEGSAPAALR